MIQRVEVKVVKGGDDPIFSVQQSIVQECVEFINPVEVQRRAPNPTPQSVHNTVAAVQHTSNVVIPQPTSSTAPQQPQRQSRRGISTSPAMPTVSTPTTVPVTSKNKAAKSAGTGKKGKQGNLKAKRTDQGKKRLAGSGVTSAAKKGRVQV